MLRIHLLLAFALYCTSSGFAQGFKIQLTKATLAAKQDPFVVYQVQFKVMSGTVQNRSEFSLVRNGALKGYAQLELAEPLSAGQATRYDEVLYVLGDGVSAGQTLSSHDLANPTVPANRPFSFKTTTAFLGDAANEFFTTISNLKGVLKIGDLLEYQNVKGQRGKGRIKEITVAQKLHPVMLMDGLPANTPVSLAIVADNAIDFSDATVTSAGTLGAAPATANAGSTPTATGKTKTIPVNAVLQNDEVTITVHNLIKFNPDPATRAYDIIKVDYTLDYYVVDATFENISSHPIDAGEYLLRLNFFSADGKSADEFLRVFKKQNGTANDAQTQADAFDQLGLGGTSKIRVAPVLMKYQSMIPDYEKTHKPTVDALNGTLKPGQKVRSLVATMMGVPPTYRIEGIGTWKGTVLSKKNLLFAPIR
ncbi:hypothetical protein F5984_22090 [Rudanella paleaurantiibacter]|uniref:Uncharacterized protein n=1 Tax=Rudanella paleaurantiibacter TaxID=2614655 RepID=A0A7J5TTU7_9BACT|nr:hypothetical protein [Rudanella paleaurantiibacter]KAB7727320.1 hypothetical protein F5984_22090 [Rudanella paleaurantiibacter]